MTSMAALAQTAFRLWFYLTNKISIVTYKMAWREAVRIIIGVNFKMTIIPGMTKMSTSYELSVASASLCGSSF